MTSKYTIAESNPLPIPVTFSRNSIVFYNNIGIDLLRIEEGGFYIRGVKVPVDENESSTVYKAFKEFLVTQALTQK